VPEPLLVDERLSDTNVASILVTGKLPHQRKHGGVDLERHSLDRAHGARMRLNRAIREGGPDSLNSVGIAGLDESSPDIAGTFTPPGRPRRRLCEPRLVERMIENDFLSKLVQRRLMVGADTWKAALVLVEAGHLRQCLPQPIAHLSAFSTGPVNTTKFQPPKSGVLVTGRLHIFLGPQETGKFKLVPHRVTKLKAKQHVGILDRALAVLLAPV